MKNDRKLTQNKHLNLTYAEVNFFLSFFNVLKLKPD